MTSYLQLFRDATAVERANRLEPRSKPRVPYVTRCLGDDPGVVVASSDNVKAIPLSVARWVRGPFTALGTDGFGRSEDRATLRDFFEVDARHVVHATLDTGDGPLPYVVLGTWMRVFGESFLAAARALAGTEAVA